MEGTETAIIHCKRCGLHTRHERKRWEKRPWLLYLIFGRVKLIEGWECTKCGHRSAGQTRIVAPKETDNEV